MAMRLGLNFAAYGEMCTLSVINILIVLCFFRYDKSISYSKKVSFFGVFTLFNPFCDSLNTLGWPLLNVLVIIISFIGPCLQMHTNWENGFTKNMSGARQILQTIIILARSMFVHLQSDSFIYQLQFYVFLILKSLLTAQFFYLKYLSQIVE